MLKVVGMLLKYELNELAITSGSLIIMSFSLMEVLDDFRFLPRMELLLDHTFLLFPKNSHEDYDNTDLWQFGLL